MLEGAEAFLFFVRPHWRRLHLLARRYVGSEHDAHDLVQETLMRAWRHFSPQSGQSYTRGWLTVILRNVAADWARSGARRVRLDPVPVSELTELVPAGLSDPLAPLPAMDERRFREFLDERITEALDQLEPVYREVLMFSVASELTYREIADVLDCPVGTVMSRMGRARRALRERLSAFAAEKGWVRGHRL